MYSNVSERGESLFAKSYDSKYKFCNTNISNLSCPNRQEEKRPHYLTIMHQFLKCRVWNKTLSKIFDWQIVYVQTVVCSKSVQIV